MKFLVIPLAMAAMAAVLGSVRPAEARDYKYCLYVNNDTAGDCYYSTYAQCMGSASGRVAYCDINPFYAFAKEPRKRTRR